MPEFLLSLTGAAPIAPFEVVGRLLAALTLGGVVAWIYRHTRTEFAATFPATLVLLAILIAMVTQVIGDSVARAFSLVGALSIVRFRTVVRDTQDTAFVIFSVVVGMACGAADPRIALIGIGVVGLAAFAMRPGSQNAARSASYLLSIRVATGQDLDTTIGAHLDTFTNDRRLTSVGTARQGIAVEASYVVTFRAGKAADELVKALNRVEGVQSVTVTARDMNEDTI